MREKFPLRHLISIAFATTVSFQSSTAFAGGAGKHGHGHEQGRIDYSDVEEHAFGKASVAATAVRTIRVDMTDTLRFDPEKIEVNRGDTIRFVVHNKGQLMHEMVLGTDESLREHSDMMRKFPGMEHEEPHMAHVSPGSQGEMGWTFTEAGEFYFGCLVPGHLEGGMKGRIVVR